VVFVRAAVISVALLSAACTGLSNPESSENAAPAASSVSADGLIEVRQPSRGVLYVTPMVGERLFSYRKAQLGDFAVTHMDRAAGEQLESLNERMASYLRESVERDFAKKNGYEIVPGPGRDVLVIDAVLRDIQITPASGGAGVTGTVFQSSDSITYGLQLSDSLSGEPLLRYYAKKHLPGGRYFGVGNEPHWLDIQNAIDALLVSSHEELDELLRSVQEAQGYPWPPVATSAAVSPEVSAAPLAGALAAAAGDEIRVGHLADHSGRTGNIGRSYAQGIADAVSYINARGGVNGKPIELLSVDFGYEMPRALNAYREWKRNDVVAILGWGIASTELLADATGEDRIPLYPASPTSPFMDPLGKGPRSERPAPYVFPMGVSYTDQSRALVRWAAESWKSRPSPSGARPSFVFMGANHPWTNLLKEIVESYAEQQGFEVLPAIEYPLYVGDFQANCEILAQSNADYALLGNTSGSNISLLKSCEPLALQTQFMAHISGFNELVMKYAGRAANGVVWTGRVPTWGTDVPGMKTLTEISKASEPDARYRPLMYERAVCNTFFLKEAIDWAEANGGVTGPNIKRGMYQATNWVPAGLEGVCPPATWTAEDHRGIASLTLYRGVVTRDAAPGAEIGELMTDGTMALERIATVEIPRRPEWLGW
jgi:branched-chain amino acid transport system substrate-binding protein